MREKLVCYLLGELDDAERAALEARLANEPCLRKELEQIRSCLEGSHNEDEPTADCPEAAALAAEGGCPEGLADRTAGAISKALAIHDGVDSPCNRSRFTFVDVCVAAGVLLAVSAMVLPALPQSRASARRALCQDNMRQIGQALFRYADNHGDFYPVIGPDENAGMFAVRLVESGQMSQRELQRLLWCRASGLQDQLRESNSQFVVVAPTAQQLQQAKGELLARIRRWMAGSYAYRIGYIDNGRYLPIKYFDSSRSPLLSDAPTYTEHGWVSVNHGVNGGQNVLHQDGHVRFQVRCDCPAVDRDMFVNYSGQAAAGEGKSDIVVVRSDLTPGVPRNVTPVVPAEMRVASPRRPPSGRTEEPSADNGPNRGSGSGPDSGSDSGLVRATK
ncbi:hypothetical protein Pla123a_02610 [Posidoniimonas polymericola]|uniref:DUF1559 domain-containing protein n=1 Tax=Posidoniimonas polymericola TaxID=2528002 RepID=A0A5C5ZDN2_9BACT|nr:DUF1559 domain-containing protein [Posidoniimonas polymericola]TWT85454.1 hypothetical protein Pla123a_02610 [Posidoniimonas polymericola]